MPTISEFFGIIIAMYFDNHNPPHFHAKYGEYEALVAIETGQLTGGNLPKRVLALVEEWRVFHKEELIRNWERAKNLQLPEKILPLE